MIFGGDLPLIIFWRGGIAVASQSPYYYSHYQGYIEQEESIELAIVCCAPLER